MPHRCLPVLLVFAGTAAGQPIRPTAVAWPQPTGTVAGVAAAWSQSSGLPIDVSAADGRVSVRTAIPELPFWHALETLAAATGHRVEVADRGRQVKLVQHAERKPPSSVDGPFRVVVREVSARRFADSGQTTYTVALDIHWEPRFPVFRVDSQPKVTAAADDLGHRLTVSEVKAKSQVGGYSHAATVHVHGLTRKATAITKLAGSFTVTASPAMLRFVWDDLSTTPAAKAEGGVTATLTRFAREDRRWEAEVELQYPPNQPAFESFESWLTRNRMRLVSPANVAFDPADPEPPAAGRTVTAVYRFPDDPAKGPLLSNRKGWKLVYETPAPLVEFPVRFELKDIPLP